MVMTGHNFFKTRCYFFLFNVLIKFINIFRCFLFKVDIRPIFFLCKYSCSGFALYLMQCVGHYIDRFLEVLMDCHKTTVTGARFIIALARRNGRKGM